MTSEVIVVEGTGYWAKLTENSRDRGSKKSEGAKYDYPEATTIQVVVDQDNLKKVSEALPGYKPNVTDNGIEVKFRRKWYNETNPSWGAEPEVTDADGNEWPKEQLIGNGSKVRVAAEVYDTRYGKAMRLMAVKVLDWVEPELPEGPELPNDF